MITSLLIVFCCVAQVDCRIAITISAPQNLHWVTVVFRGSGWIWKIYIFMCVKTNNENKSQFSFIHYNVIVFLMWKLTLQISIVSNNVSEKGFINFQLFQVHRIPSIIITTSNQIHNRKEFHQKYAQERYSREIMI